MKSVEAVQRPHVSEPSRTPSNWSSSPIASRWAPDHGPEPVRRAPSGGFHRDLSLVPAAVRSSSGPGPENQKRLAGTRLQPASGVWDARAISASGAGTVTTTYAPEAGDRSTKIVFIQVMRELLDGVPAKPSVIAPGFAYQDKDTTSDFFHVDYVSGEKDPYYNGDDPADPGVQGNAQATPKVAASTSDAPNYSDASFPAGTSKVDWEFRIAAFSAAGPDAGTFYGFVDWAYEKEKGKAAATKIGSTSTKDPGGKFMSAVRLFNTNHGFAMPGGGPSVLGGLIGGGLGALAGAGIGFVVGGPVGAVIGGLIGLAAGGLVGAFDT